jgi:hypothetical protein
MSKWEKYKREQELLKQQPTQTAPQPVVQTPVPNSRWEAYKKHQQEQERQQQEKLQLYNERMGIEPAIDTPEVSYQPPITEIGRNILKTAWRATLQITNPLVTAIDFYKRDLGEGIMGDIKTMSYLTALNVVPEKRNEFIAQNPEAVIQAADTFDRYVGGALRRAYPSKITLATAEKIIGKQLAPTYEELSQKYPVSTALSGLLGDIYNVTLLSRVLGPLGISANVSAKLPGGLKVWSPFLSRYMPMAAERGMLWGTKGFMDTITDQFRTGEWDFQEIASESGKNALFGVLLSAGLSAPTPTLQIGGSALGLGGMTALEKYIEDGTLDGPDLIEVGASMILGAFFGILGMKDRIKGQSIQRINDMSYRKLEIQIGAKNAANASQWNYLSTLSKTPQFRNNKMLQELLRVTKSISAVQTTHLSPKEVVNLLAASPEASKYNYKELQLFVKMATEGAKDLIPTQVPYAIEQSIKTAFPHTSNFQSLKPVEQNALISTAFERAIDAMDVGKTTVDVVIQEFTNLLEERFGVPETAQTREENIASKEIVNQVYQLAEQAGYRVNNKFTDEYVETAEAMTKTINPEEMTQTEAQLMASYLDDKIRSKVALPDAFLESEIGMVSNLSEIGYKERYRKAEFVFDKMGISDDPMFDPDEIMTRELNLRDDWYKFQKTMEQKQQSVRNIRHSGQRIFRYLDGTLDKDIQLTQEELKVAEWARKLLDEWADRLNLPADKRRENYITHIIEKDISDSLDSDLPVSGALLSMIDPYKPRTMFNPNLQKRFGVEAGLREDVWLALSAYTARQLKIYHYEPLLEKINLYKHNAPSNTARWLDEYSKRLTGEPLQIDKEIKQDMVEFAQTLKKVKGMEKIADALEQGNPAAIVSHLYTGILYEVWLGLRPISAIKNLSQQGLCVAEVGLKHYMSAKSMQYTQKGKDIIKKSVVMRSREDGFFLPTLDETFIKQLHGKRRRVTMAMFKAADRDNVGASFLAGYNEAMSHRLPEEWAIKRGDEVARKTQYAYTKLMSDEFSRNTLGKLLGVFTSWPRNWAELMNDWIKNKPSKVYMKYTKQTGRAIKGFTASGDIDEVQWIKNKSSLWRYLLIVMLGFGVERATKLKGSYYTGWTSIGSLSDFANGNIPGLNIPGAVLSLLAGISTGDTDAISRAWKNINPANQIIIIKQLTDILDGKKTWLDLFLYLDNTKDGKPSPFQSEFNNMPLEFDMQLDMKQLDLELKNLEFKLDW